MFTGLIKEVGTVAAFRANGEAKRLEITAPQLAGGIRVGDSVAVNGCCLTVASRDGNQLTFDVLQESLDRTNLKNLQPESRVNLELALTVAEVLPKSFAVWIIPHTRAQTNLATTRRGDLVNLEFDLLAKYVERLLDRRGPRPK